MAIWQDAGSSKPHWVPCLIPLQNHGWKLAVRFCRMDIQPCESWIRTVRLYCFSIYFLCCSCPCLFMGSSQFRISCWCLPPWSFWLRMQPAHRPRDTLTEQQPSSDRECITDMRMVVGPSPERILGKQHRSMDVRFTLAIWCSWSLECKVTLPAALILARELGVSSLREWAQQHRPQAD